MRFSRLCCAVLAGPLALTCLAAPSRDNRRLLQPAARDDLLVPASAPPKIKVLIRRLQSPDAKVRKQAAEALGKLGWEAADAVPALMAATYDPRGNVQKFLVYHACRDAIVNIGKPGVPYIIAALNNPNQPNYRRSNFIQLLCDVAEKHGPASIAAAVPSLTKILVKGMQAQSPPFVGDAARALGQAGRHAKSAVPTLIRALAWVKSRRFSGQTIAYALIRIAGPNQPQARACLAQLRRNARLKSAANLGNLADVKALLKAGADVNAQYNVAGGFFHKGVSYGFSDNTKSTPLINASLRGDVAIVKVLLDAGADPNIAHASTGKTALDYAKQRFVFKGRKQNHDAVIQLLKAAGGKSGRLGIRKVTGIKVLPPQPFPRDKRLNQMITYHFPQQTPLRQVLQVISRQSGVNLRLHPNLRGRTMMSIRVSEPLRKFMRNQAAHKAVWVRERNVYLLLKPATGREKEEPASE